MSKKDKKAEGELSEEQLDGVSGGQEVKKMGRIVVRPSAFRPSPRWSRWRPSW